jgi:pimeloyl-ACP methyl ester carboxylesterase
MASTPTPDCVQIAYDRTGDGPAVVLVHGITECRQAWEPLLPDLAADHTIVAIDMRGHGESGLAGTYDPQAMAGDVAAVAEGLDLPAPLVVGHSMGGIVATTFAAAHPCRGVVNVDQSIDLGDFQDLVRSAEPMLRGDEFAGVLSALFDSMQGPLPDDEVARIRALRQPRQDVVLGVWAPLLALSRDELDALVAALAGRVRVPYLALHGSDPGADYGEWLTRTIPTATVEVWEGDGHYPHLVEPARFVDRLRAFESSLA